MNATPTLYEWAGGKAAIRRLMGCFYDRVERDELLSPYFPGGVSEEHRAHVAAWWSEVPRRISASASSEHFVETPHQYLRRRGTGARGGARELSN